MNVPFEAFREFVSYMMDMRLSYGEFVSVQWSVKNNDVSVKECEPSPSGLMQPAG